VTDYAGRLYIVVALPRSRTQWFTWFFNEALVAWHDPLKNCESIDELGTKVDRALFGKDARANKLMIVDTAALFFGKELIARFPGAKFITIKRPAREVDESLKRKTAYSLRVMMQAHAYFNHWCEYGAPKGSLTLAYDMLSHPVWLMQAWSYVFGSLARFPDHVTLATAIEHRVDVPLRLQRMLGNEVKYRKLLRGVINFGPDTVAL
jgi:hypothetical protein